MELNVCQTDERVVAAAPELVKQGEETAKMGNGEVAIAFFQQALAWKPDIDINSTVRAKQFSLIGKGETYASNGEFEQAIETFEQALALEPSINLNPQEQAQQMASQAMLQRGEQLMEQGNFAAAIASFTKAQDIEPELEIPANTWNTLCWNGSLQGYAQQVLDGCEQAVTLEPTNGNIRDSRGLARGLTGDVEGAIADFQFFIEQTDDEEARSLRQQWIEALNAGENPFSPGVLERLQ